MSGLRNVVPYLVPLGLLVAGTVSAEATYRVAILPFTGMDKSEQLAGMIELELELAENLVITPREKVLKHLRRSADRCRAQAVAKALKRASVDLALCGRVGSSADGPQIHVLVFDQRGRALLDQTLTLLQDQGLETVAQVIADMLQTAIAEGGAGADDAADDFGGDGDEGGGRGRLLDDAADDGGSLGTTTGADTDAGSSHWADQVDTGDSAPAGDNTLRDQIPYTAAALAFELVYWSYGLEADLGRSRVPWSPAQPAMAGSLRIESWPVIYAGLDAQARMGKLSVDLAQIEGLDQQEVEVILYEAQMHLRGRYVFDFGWRGLGIGARIGYRFLMADTAMQTPFTVVPGYQAHIVSPGIECHLPFHPQYAVLDASLEFSPLSLYAEVPDAAGDPTSPSSLGWRADLLFRSVLLYGFFVEARAFYEELYVTYTGLGSRTNYRQQRLSEGRVDTGLRGVSLAVGWSY